jgi:hypothetical protein
MNQQRRPVVRMLGTMLAVGLIAKPSFGQWVAYGPGPRDQHTAVFDSATDQMIAFGGTDLGTINYNDVWVAANITAACTPDCDLQWSFVIPGGTAPAGRSGHSAVYDSVNSRMIVFGGALGFPAPCANDVWVLANANGVGGTPTWIELNPSGPLPPARSGHVAAYDPNTNVLIIFGGTNCDGDYLSDVWVLNNANGLGTGTRKWRQLAPTGTNPPGRAYAVSVYNSAANQLVVYGGFDSTTLPDLWVLSDANGTKKTSSWSPVSPAGTPPPARYGAVSGYDSTDDIMIINGGYSTAGILGDTWVLQNATGAAGTPTWASLTTSHAGPQIYFHSGIYDPASNELVVFAGISERSPNPLLADDHVFFLSEANGK